MAFWNRKEKGDMAKKKTAKQPADEPVVATSAETAEQPTVEPAVESRADAETVEVPAIEPAAEHVITYAPKSHASKAVLDELVEELNAHAAMNRRSAASQQGAGSFATNAQAAAYEHAAEMVKAKM